MTNFHHTNQAKAIHLRMNLINLRRVVQLITLELGSLTD